MDASLMKRMKELEDENRRLKKMYAEERLISEVRKEADLPAFFGPLASRVWSVVMPFSAKC
jgi:hypothetical protein